MLKLVFFAPYKIKLCRTSAKIVISQPDSLLRCGKASTGKVYALAQYLSNTQNWTRAHIQGYLIYDSRVAANILSAMYDSGGCPFKKIKKKNPKNTKTNWRAFKRVLSCIFVGQGKQTLSRNHKCPWGSAKHVFFSRTVKGWCAPCRGRVCGCGYACGWGSFTLVFYTHLSAVCILVYGQVKTV